MIKYLLSLILVFQSLASKSQDSVRVFAQNDLYGLVGSDDEVLVQPNYDQLGWSDGTERPVKASIGYRQNLWGLLSLKGKKLTRAVYYELKPLKDEIVLSGIKGKFSNRIFYGLLSTKGKVLLSSTYTSIRAQDNAFIVTKNESEVRSYGLLNENLKFILPVEYKDIQRFAEGVFVFQNKDSKYGLINAAGNILLEASIDNIEYVNGYSIVHIAGAKGLIDATGEVVVDAKYRALILSENDQVEVEEFPTWSVITDQNEEVLVQACDSMQISEHYYLTYRNGHLQIQDKSLSVVIEGDKLSAKQIFDDKLVLTIDDRWGALKGGKEFLSFEYDSLYYSDGYYYGRKNSGWSVINKFGRTITSRHYEEVKHESEGLMGVRNNGYWGFIDFQGEEVVPSKFDFVEPFRHRAAKVRFLDSYGTINHFGEWVCEPVYDALDITDFGLVVALINSRTDVLNADGNVTFQTFNKLSHHEVGFLEQTLEGGKGLISNYGVRLLYPYYDNISNLIKDSLIVAKSGAEVGAINLSGKWVVPISSLHEEIVGLNEGRISIKKDGLYGFLDMQGLLRVANRYDSVKLFHEGMAAIKLRNSWGFIDMRERLAIQPTYDDVGYFFQGEAPVLEGSKWGTIDKKGVVQIPVKFERIERLSHGYYKVYNEHHKLGLYGRRGQRIASPKFTHLSPTDLGYFIVNLRGKYGVINDSGLFSIPQIYDKVIHAGEDVYFCIEHGDSSFIVLDD